MIKAAKISTPAGDMVAAATKEGVCLLEFRTGQLSEDQCRRSAGFPETEKIREGNNRHLRLLKKQLGEYFKGKRKEFTVSLDINGSSFQTKAWKALMEIPYGTTISYKEQAGAIKMPGSARAVAKANATNRIAIIIPCHRVIGSDGRLVGYGGGIKTKEWLLNHERKYSGKPVDLTLL